MLAHALLMERLLPDDEAEVYSVTIDEWMISRELGDTPDQVAAGPPG